MIMIIGIQKDFGFAHTRLSILDLSSKENNQ